MPDAGAVRDMSVGREGRHGRGVMGGDWWRPWGGKVVRVGCGRGGAARGIGYRILELDGGHGRRCGGHVNGRLVPAESAYGLGRILRSSWAKAVSTKNVAERQNMGGVGRAVPGSSGSFYLRVRWPQVVFLRKIVFSVMSPNSSRGQAKLRA